MIVFIFDLMVEIIIYEVHSNISEPRTSETFSFERQRLTEARDDN